MITKSYTFTNNTTIDPDEVNQNFDDLLDSIKAAHHADEDGTLITYSDINTDWGLIPKGGIIAWSGAISAIPTGYLLCNGSDGTRDLRGKMIFGAQADSAATYDVGDTGGSATINIAHSHTVNAHTHTYSGTTGSENNLAGAEGYDSGGGEFADKSHEHAYSGTTSGASDSITNSRLSATQSVLNPYMALAWIQKV